MVIYLNNNNQINHENSALLHYYAHIACRYGPA
jgi:hypothetical protein